MGYVDVPSLEELAHVVRWAATHEVDLTRWGYRADVDGTHAHHPEAGPTCVVTTDRAAWDEVTAGYDVYGGEGILPPTAVLAGVTCVFMGRWGYDVPPFHGGE